MPASLKQLKKEQLRTSTPSDLLVELHVYIVPVDKWIPFRKLVRNTVVEETVSAGFVRVPPLSTLLELRGHLQNQLEFDIPDHFVFIKSVGRNFTQVKGHQEHVVKVKNFLPPQAVEPEIHILEVSKDLINKSGSVPNLLLSDTELSDNAGFGTFRNSRNVSQSEEVLNGSSLGLPRGVQYSENEIGASDFSTGQSFEDGGRTSNLASPDNNNSITLDYKVGGTNGTADSVSSIKIKNRIRGDRTKSSHDDDRSKDEIRDSQSRRKITRKNARTLKGNISKSVPSSNYDSSGDSHGEDGNEEMEEKSDSFSDSFSRPSGNELNRSASLNVLNRTYSQISLAEEGDEGEIKTSRSGKTTYNNQNKKRSTSVSLTDRGKATAEKVKNGYVKSKRAVSEDRSRYHPHKWTIRREAENLPDNEYFDESSEEASLNPSKSRQARHMLAEHETAREALRNQEAKKFEEQIRKEEELEEKYNKKKYKNNKAEIFNSEGKISVNEVVAPPKFVNKCTKKLSKEHARPSKNGEKPHFDDEVKDIGLEVTYDVELNNDAIGTYKSIRVKKNSLIKKQPKKGAWQEKEQERKKSLRRNDAQKIPEDNSYSKVEAQEQSETDPNCGKFNKNNAFKKKRIEATLQEVLKEKTASEDERTEYFMKARALHEEILAIKEKRRQKWWDEYNLARRKGTRLEERQGNLRQELEGLYRRVIGSLMRKEPFVTGVKGAPSRKASYKISVIRLRHEIADLIRRVEAIDIKLEAETRLRQQAEQEVKLLRSEVSRKKANVALTQSKTPHLRNIAHIPEDILIRL